MKQMAFSKVLTILACALVLCVVAPGLVFADQAQYIYDDLGRISQVIDGQVNVATYNYIHVSTESAVEYESDDRVR